MRFCKHTGLSLTLLLHIGLCHVLFKAFASATLEDELCKIHNSTQAVEIFSLTARPLILAASLLHIIDKCVVLI